MNNKDLQALYTRLDILADSENALMWVTSAQKWVPISQLTDEQFLEAVMNEINNGYYKDKIGE